MSAVLYGYTKAEVEKAFDQIVSIAEIEKFIDVPVKKFSSGMRMKLAFSLAMITRPDIVLLDEAFAVGDSRFVEKSEKMMRSFLEGRTLVLVSHSLKQIRSVCDRVIVLNHGQVVLDGPVQEGCDFYTKLQNGNLLLDAKKEVIQPNITRGSAEVPTAEFENVHLMSTQDDIIQCGVLIRIQKINKNAFLRVTVKKDVMGQLYDTIDRREFIFDEQKATVIQKTVSIDISNLYGSRFILLFEVWTDLNGRTTALEVFELPVEVARPLNPGGIVDLSIMAE